jgi:hypothetical protein
MRSLLANAMAVLLIASSFTAGFGLLIGGLGGAFRDEVAEGIGSLMIRCGLAVFGGVIAVLAIMVVTVLALAP